MLHHKKLFIFIEKEDNYLYEYHQLITDFQVNTDNPNKDTIDYMFCMCYKTECIKMAIHFMKQHNLFEDKIEYIWLDFGIYHIVKNDNLFQEELNQLVKRPLNKNNKIRIAAFPNNINNSFNLTKNVCWFFLGGIFGGFEEELLLFFDGYKLSKIELEFKDYSKLELKDGIFPNNLIKNVFKIKEFMIDKIDLINDKLLEFNIIEEI
jgi:hypothetical protein